MSKARYSSPTGIPATTPSLTTQTFQPGDIIRPTCVNPARSPAFRVRVIRDCGETVDVETMEPVLASDAKPTRGVYDKRRVKLERVA